MPDLCRGILERMLPLELVPMHKKIISGYFSINQGKGTSFAMVCWIESTDRDALLFCHSLF
jgi:hypothetical protein